MPDHYVNDPGDLVLLGSFDTEYKAHTLRPNVFYAKSVLALCKNTIIQIIKWANPQMDYNKTKNR